MSSYLHPSEYLEHAPSRAGDLVNVNHEGCPAGVDTKRRLYVKRINDTRVVAYCHHCSRSGVSTRRSERGASNGRYSSLGGVSHGGKRPDEEGRESGKGRKRSATPSNSAVTNPAEWPFEARAWLSKYGFKSSGGWYYEPGLRRLCHTLTDTSGTPAVKVCRDVTGTSDKKYLNFSVQTRLARPALRKDAANCSDCVVIVEDILSAQRIVESGYDALPLLTTSLKEIQVEYLTTSYKHATIIVWLDDDNYSVLRDRDKIKRTLQLINKNVFVVDSKGDPKNFSTSQVQEIIDNVRTQVP